MPRKPSCRPHSLLIFLSILSVFLSFAGIVQYLQSEVSLTVSEARYVINGTEEHHSPLPLSFTSTGQDIDIFFDITHTSSTPTVFTVIPDDCLEELSINGTTFPHEDIPFCDWSRGRTFDLTEVLHDGTNQIHARVKDNGNVGGLQLHAQEPPWYNALTLLRYALLFLAGTYACTALLRSIPATSRIPIPILILLIGGILLRVLYVSATPHTVRGHDTEGHIDYINHIQNEMRIPHPSDGWEFYQPPAYYALGALWQGLTELLPFPLPYSHPQQTLSLLLAIFTFCLFVGIGILLFPTKREYISRTLFIATCATFPGIVFFSARINNDTLSLLLNTLALFFLLRFWNTHTWRVWLLLCIVLGVSLLTKTTAALMIGTVFFCLLLVPRLTRRKRFLFAIAGGTLLLLLAGWFHIPRTLQTYHTKTTLVGNIRNLNSALRLENDLENYTIFHPAKILEHPFNNPWHDDARRQYFWEYFYRSAFFGEFRFNVSPFVLENMLALGMVLLLFLPVGLFSRPLHPLLPLLCILTTGAIAVRYIHPFSSISDFRYSALLVIPVSYYILQGLQKLPHEWKTAGSTVYGLFLLFCTTFLILLSP
ncbi:hypothetical protein COU77_00995 [Candidatus Peregrinibacteria bacterium CG10_big_fil_rev_8_21_14_0_10_49_16]|nr:MAG: hypothetical protein COW95_03385 [Candidatus Peregrinibacteria bacterium CG22_combo_CG10-13_8_21_14_all_49_11]PIR52310.1 MAG: hypothetical protein COU77_00995 [Candidatus Peregrinibacteria bacterium CG10_big_fil_rev_8_21_14_0_10_49_16]